MKPTFFLDNPQASSLYGPTVFEWFAGSKLNSKWPFLIEFLRTGNAGIYDSGKRSMPFPPFKKLRKLKPIWEMVEFYFWLLIHGINPFKVKVIKDPKMLSKEDTFFSFIHGRYDQTTTWDFIDFVKSEAKKVVHISHFNFYPEAIREGFEKAGVDVFVGESNLFAKNSFFMHCFPNSKAHFQIIPYGFAERFVKRANWEQRKQKCVATGSFQKISAERDGCGAYIKFFKTDTLHTLRRTIYQNKENLSDIFNIVMSDLDADIQKPKAELPEYSGKNPVMKMYIYCRKIYLVHMLTHHGRRPYYDFNIVSLYNSYKMFVVPEEVVGIPAIGFVEGMACGAAYIGLDHAMYRDIGLIPGVHYIVYDGSLTDLQLKVKYYIANDEELEVIARQGHEFVVRNFSVENVRTLFYEKFIQKEQIGVKSL